MEGCIIHEVLISPLAASGMTYEVLISQFLPGRLDLRGFDLRKDNIYTIYIMYIRGFDLASDTQTGCYLRGLDLTQSDFGLLQCTRFWSLCWRDAGSWFTRFVSLFDVRNPPKRDQNLVNGVTLGEAGGGHQMWFTFIKKQQDIGNQIGRFLRKTLIFAGKEAEKTGVFRIREVEIHKKRWKVIILYRVYR